ncbi:MAG: transcription termination/antitermination protein NusG [Lentisphaerae bacterium]|nr:transcription termination/antitermination protein NusG [Lentisphaerota bacterium]
MEKQWFVVHTLTGKEVRVKESLERRTSTEEMGDLMGEVSIPSEKVSEVKKGKKTTVTRMFYPGYVLVQMALYNDDGSLNERSWYYVRETPGVIGFAGGERPRPLSAAEVEAVMYQIEDKKEKVKPKIEFAVGETVKINDGPFLNFNGVIEDVDPERGKLRVSVAIFGRTAPVELEYWQIERV